MKTRAGTAFTRFDAASAGLTRSCYGEGDRLLGVDVAKLTPPPPPVMCPVISVAGTSAGKAVIGFKGAGTDQDKDAPWALKSGGADVVTFDGTALRRDRHVLVASPPGYVCEDWVCDTVSATDPTKCATFRRDARGDRTCKTWIGSTWVDGRMKMRQIQRIAVNRRAGIGRGDVLMGGTHGTFSILVANPAQRGWDDYTKGDPAWADAKYVFEHEHPDMEWPDGRLLYGDAWALAFDPTTGIPWGANQFRMAALPGYVSMRKPFVPSDPSAPWWGDMAPGRPYITFWSPIGNPDDGSERDNVTSLSFCDDGTLWVGSLGHGLARRSPDGTVSYVSPPAPYGGAVNAVACDPSDRSVWVGMAFGGGVLRYKSGAWTAPPADAPPFVVEAPVRSIQIDRWGGRRIVYAAHQSYRDGAGVLRPGGVSAYAGP